MKIVMQAAIVLIIIMLCECSYLTFKSKSQYKQSLIAVYICGAITLTAYFGFTLSKDRVVAMIYDALYFLCIDWLVFSMLVFIQNYTESYKKNNLANKLICVVAVLDSISLITNTFTEHSFSLSLISSEESDNIAWATTMYEVHYIHLAFSYVIIAYIFCLIIMKMRKSSKMYRNAYNSIFYALLLVIVINFICYNLDTQLDVSVLFYGLLAAMICYFTIYSTPKGLVTNMLVSMTDTVMDAIICYDVMGRKVFVNAKAEEILKEDYKLRRNKDKNRKIINKYFEEWKKSENKEQCKSIELALRVKGEKCVFNVEFFELIDKDDVVGSYIKLTDITSEIEAFNEENYKATHDSLTGIYNRDKFFEETQRVINETPDIQRYMVSFNIKDFKHISKLFGEEKANEILISQAELIRKISNRGYVYGKLGENSFALVLPCKYFSEEIIMKHINNMQPLGDESVYKLHIYVGVYKITDPKEKVEIMYDKTQLAIETADGDYQKVFIYYDDKLMKRLVYENNVVNEFGDAISDKVFEMYLRPQTDINGKIVGAQSVACWNHSIRGVIRPDKFESILEKTGYIYLLDMYMWDKAIAQQKRWQDAGITDKYISVKIGEKDKYYMDIYKTFVSLVNTYKVSPGNIRIGISENALMSDASDYSAILKKLQSYGFKIEIYDFGEGYSSLNMLKELCFDCVKIRTNILSSSGPEMFVFQDEEDVINVNNKNIKRNKKIFEIIIKMSNRLGMPVVVSDVDDAKQLEYLKETGASYFEGKAVYDIMTVKEFEKKIF